MSLFAAIARAWSDERASAGRTRILLGAGFLFGAISHVWWVFYYGKGDLWFHGPGPVWAPWFWYSICVLDVVEAWLLLARPRIGVAIGAAIMATTLWVNWTQFPLTPHPGQFNLVLAGLTLFGVLYFLMTPWLWAKTKLSPPSSAHSGG